MTDEKKLDRQFLKGVLEYRKFEDKSTCPTCNCKEILAPLLKFDHYWDEEKENYIEVKRKHDPDNCFRKFAGILLATNKNKDGTFWSDEKLESILENGLRQVKSMNRKFTVGRK